jgi:bacterioferritin-associated ferredoxin
MCFIGHIDMIVCICRRVSDRTIRAAAQQGASFEDIQFEHGVSTCCGRCEECARDIWRQGREGAEGAASVFRVCVGSPSALPMPMM